jgi:ABC-2 type transport system ATP-binding protein
MDSDALIDARGLAQRYGATLALDGVNLTLRKGEVLGLLGPNGAGKSTTMKILTGNLSPTAGAVRVCGHDLREEPKAAKRHLGYLPEQPPVYPELTVDEYLGYCAALRGIASGQRRDALDSAKRACGLSDVGHRLVGNLSKGYQQRVGIAQAIIHRPEVVILDEPTVGLDPIQIREIRALIAELGREHSVVLSSHILPEIQAVCGRVMIIRRGRVVMDAPVDAHQARRTVVVGLVRPPAAEQLAAIRGVAGVEPLGDGRFRLDTVPGDDPRERIAAAAVSANWGLIELRQHTKTLEELFVELTSADQAAGVETVEAAA